MTDKIPAFLTAKQPPQRGNGPQPPSVEEGIAELARTVERHEVDEKQHPALAACKRAADMVRGVHERHSAEGETMAQHLEKIGEEFAAMCKEAADQIRKQRILPAEMADRIAENLLEIGHQEAERQATVARGLTAARDAILGIDAKDSTR
jgi:uncharacterized coiled-coil DUF342 family protein